MSFRWGMLWLTLLVAGFIQAAENPDQLAAARLPATSIFSGTSGLRVDWESVLSTMDSADVIVIGESHADFDGHAIQTALLEVAVLRWPGMMLSLEEFDRSQQAALDAFSRGAMTGAQLYEIRAFVDLKVKANWQEWYLPKLAVARDAGVPMLASNAPLKYSRMVRNRSCDNLPELEKSELALFDCPSVPLDPEYRARFARTFTSAVRGSDTGGVKQLNNEQIDVLFRAHRVWDATMAESIARARAQGAKKVLHLVGGFHAEFEGGLIQELRARDPSARILVISLSPRRSDRLAPTDLGKADFLVYTRS